MAKVPVVVKDWRRACANLAEEFQDKYFPSKFGRESYWVAGDVGGVFYINDMFFNTERMVEALVLRATYGQLAEYNELGMREGGPRISFKNFVKYGMIVK